MAWTKPTWRRSIAAGDIIWNAANSHIYDLNELTTVLNARRALYGLSAVSISNYIHGEYAYYKDWQTMIQILRTGMEECRTLEGRTWSWTSLAAGAWPTAAAINELRQYLEDEPGGQKETFNSTAYARTVFSEKDHDFTVDRSEEVRWYARGPMSGMNWGYEEWEGVANTKVYNRRFGFWLLPSVTDKVILSAKMTVTSNNGESGTHPINLYGVKASAVPTAKTSVNAVLGTTLLGTAEVTGGEGTFTVPLNAEGIAALKAGTIYGLGVDDHQYWKNFEESATLTING